MKRVVGVLALLAVGVAAGWLVHPSAPAPPPGSAASCAAAVRQADRFLGLTADTVHTLTEAVNTTSVDTLNMDTEHLNNLTEQIETVGPEYNNARKDCLG